MAVAQQFTGSGGGGRARVRRAWKKVITWPQQGQRISALSGRDSTTPPARRSWRTRAGEMASAGENSRPGCPARHPAGCRSHGNSRHRSMYPCSGFLPWHRHRVGHPAGRAGRLFSPLMPPHAGEPAGQSMGSTRAPRVVFRAARKPCHLSAKRLIDPFATTVGAMAERRESGAQTVPFTRWRAALLLPAMFIPAVIQGF